jgi:hypothetical protein
MRRTIAPICTALAFAAAIGMYRGTEVEQPDDIAPSMDAPDVSVVRTADVSGGAEPEQPTRFAFSRRGDRALAKIEKTEADLEHRLDLWVEEGEITEAEARELYRISKDSLADARTLVERVRSGEIYWISGVVRQIPVRIRHVTQVVNLLGTDGARQLRASARERDWD